MAVPDWFKGGLNPGEAFVIIAETSRDKIAAHLIKQHARAVEPYPPAHPELGTTASRCQYRTADGLMCAAGCLIPEEHYVAEMEGMTAYQVSATFPRAFPEDVGVRELELWQAYHYHYVTICGTRYSYDAWLHGKESESPIAFKEAVAQYLLGTPEYGT